MLLHVDPPLQLHRMINCQGEDNRTIIVKSDS